MFLPLFTRVCCLNSQCTLKTSQVWLCVDDMNYCVGGMKCKYVVEKSTVFSISLVQEGTNFLQDEVKFFEKTCFVFNK